MSVDVIIPIFNQAKYLPMALESCFGQGVLNKNIYVIDDGSTDNPKTICSKYKVSYLRSDSNIGPAAARNLGIKNSNSEFIAFLDADDLMLPGRISFSLKKICLTEGVMVCGNYKFLINRERVTHQFYKNPVDITYEKMLENNYVACGSVLLRRDVLNDIGLFNEDYNLAEDYDLWLRIAEKHKIHYIHEPLYLYSRNTIEKKSLTSNPNNLNKLVENIKKIKLESSKRKGLLNAG